MNLQILFDTLHPSLQKRKVELRKTCESYDLLAKAKQMVKALRELKDWYFFQGYMLGDSVALSIDGYMIFQQLITYIEFGNLTLEQIGVTESEINEWMGRCKTVDADMKSFNHTHYIDPSTCTPAELGQSVEDSWGEGDDEEEY